MNYSTLQIWALIVALGLGTLALRLSFLGLVGSRKLPDWLLRHLRYTPVAVLPGLIAPQILFPAATGGTPDPARLAAAAVALAVGVRTGSVLWALGSGMGLLLAITAVTG